MKHRWLVVLGTNDADKTITVAIGDSRYEYWLHDLAYVEHAFELKKRARSQSQQLAWIKQHSTKYEKL